MKLTTRMVIYSAMLYVFILLVAVNYNSYYLIHYNNIATNPLITQVVNNPSSQNTTLYYIIAELVVISIVGFLEVKYKFIRKMITWLENYPVAKIALYIVIVAILPLILFFGFDLQIAVGAGVLAIVFLFLPNKYKMGYIFSIIGFFPVLYLLSITALASIAFYIYFACVVCGIIVIGEYPNKATFNVLGVILCICLALWFGLILEPLLMVILLAVMAIYDYIAVFKTKHMTLMAGTLLGTLPIAFILGDIEYLKKKLAPSTDKTKPNKTIVPEERKAMLLGLGDIAIPAAVFVSFLFVGNNTLAIAGVIGASIGIFANMVWLERKKEALPAIPLIAISMFICIGIGILMMVVL